MNTGVKVQGGKVEKEAVEAVAGAVVQVFEAAAKTNMDQDTVQRALDTLGRMGVVEGTTISGSQFSG